MRIQFAIPDCQREALNRLFRKALPQLGVEVNGYFSGTQACHVADERLVPVTDNAGGPVAYGESRC